MNLKTQKGNLIFPKRIRQGFTVIELMVVMVIIATIAAFALPNFSKSIERTHESDAMMQLRAVHASNQIYRARMDAFWPPNGWAGGTAIADINTALGLNLIANDMTYACATTGNNSTFSCTAVRNAPAPSFTVTVNQNVLDGNNPCCVAGGACPNPQNVCP